ncbi:hypothetical protein B566_EDAN018350, partial [Ephemera danica]
SDIFTWIWKDVWPLGKTTRIWIFNKAQIGIAGARDAEPILRSSKLITKSDSYKFLRPWLGDGLITADGDHWRKLRKILTPAFHFEILHEFLPIFVNQSLTMVKLLSAEPAATSEHGFDISEYSSRYIFTWAWKDVWPLGKTTRVWVFNKAQIGIAGARDAEPILRSSKFITKSDSYKFLRPWLGDGLITAD